MIKGAGKYSPFCFRARATALSNREILLWIAGCRVQSIYMLTNLLLTSSLFGLFGIVPPTETPKPIQVSTEKCSRASWYGPGFNGNLTANGERFDQYALTAAHKYLPFGTRVRVTNRYTGKSVIVRINDRGPFYPGRDLDLSRGAAAKVGMIGSGHAPVCYSEV